MPDTSILAALVGKAKALGGPVAAALLVGVSAGWYAHGERGRVDKVEERVAALDSATVKRYEFERAMERIEAVAVRQDSTNSLLRRYICREQPTICP